MHRTRNLIIESFCQPFPDYLLLIGKGWDKIGVNARKEHSGLPAAGEYYSASRASLNLFGGCVHGGMPLRPYEITSSHGLIVTHDNRELPSLFEPGKECLSFQNADELASHIDRLIQSPAEFNRIVHADRARTLAHHTWQHRLKIILDAAQQKFGAW